MRAAVHIVPAAGVELDRDSDARRPGTGIATAALQTVGMLGEAVDLVLIAVPAGSGRELVMQLLRNGEAADATV